MSAPPLERHRPHPRRVRLVITATVPGICCDECGQEIEVGATATVWDDWPAIVHREGRSDAPACPPRWTPEVIDGDRRDDGQPELALRPTLTVIASEVEP